MNLHLHALEKVEIQLKKAGYKHFESTNIGRKRRIFVLWCNYVYDGVIIMIARLSAFHNSYTKEKTEFDCQFQDL